MGGGGGKSRRSSHPSHSIDLPLQIKKFNVEGLFSPCLFFSLWGIFFSPWDLYPHVGGRFSSPYRFFRDFAPLPPPITKVPAGAHA